VKENKIPFEVCITSNIFTGKYVREEENHPVRQFYDNGIIVTLNTDDPEIFDVRLSDEYLKLYDKLNFSIEEIIEIVKNSVLATFNPNKEELWYHMKREIDKLRKIYEL
jgi:adenosine deaminase